MKIEEGKYYITRDGRKFGPMEPFHDSKYSWECEGYLWMNDGTGYEECSPEQDFVSEWKDEPTTSGPTLSGDTIDHIAIDSLKWHYNEGQHELEPLQKEAFKIVLRYYGVSL